MSFFVLSTKHQNCLDKSLVSDLSKFDLLLHKTMQGPSFAKVPRFPICRFIILLSKIINQMWCDHPFNHRIEAAKRAVGDGDWGVGQSLKKGVGNIGASS